MCGSVWRIQGNKAHATREQPMDTGPNKPTPGYIECNFFAGMIFNSEAHKISEHNVIQISFSFMCGINKEGRMMTSSVPALLNSCNESRMFENWVFHGYHDQI